MWLNEDDIANLVSIPQLERDGYTGTYDMCKAWLVYTRDGTPIYFGYDRGDIWTDSHPLTSMSLQVTRHKAPP